MAPFPSPVTLTGTGIPGAIVAGGPWGRKKDLLTGIQDMTQGHVNLKITPVTYK